ncbi:MAG: hypothetical protein H6716_21965 [Polyangiaceae bacterium]|nr:hypothetical protein [Polyangiaceae bacterium]
MCALVLTTGCKRGANPECTAARDAARDAALKDDLEQAKAKLAEARKTCDKQLDFDLSRIQQQIDRKEQRMREERAREQARAAERVPLTPFIDWVKQLRESDDKHVEGEQCAARGTPDFGFCLGERKLPGGIAASVRYLERDAVGVYRFQAEVTSRVVCSDLGGHRLVHAWRSGAEERFHCELTASPLKGLVALIQNPIRGGVGSADPGSASAPSVVSVFTSGYLERDQKLSALLNSANK